MKIKLNFEESRRLEYPLKTFWRLLRKESKRRLQCNYSNWGTWKKSIQSQSFLKKKTKKRFSSFFSTWTNEIQGSTMHPLKTLKLFELT